MYRIHRNHLVLGSELRPKLGKPQICLLHSVCLLLLLFACQDESSAPTLDELGISEVLGEGEGDAPSVPTTPPKGTPVLVQTCHDQRQYVKVAISEVLCSVTFGVGSAYVCLGWIILGAYCVKTAGHGKPHYMCVAHACHLWLYVESFHTIDLCLFDNMSIPKCLQLLPHIGIKMF